MVSHAVSHSSELVGQAGGGEGGGDDAVGGGDGEGGGDETGGGGGGAKYSNSTLYQPLHFAKEFLQSTERQSC